MAELINNDFKQPHDGKKKKGNNKLIEQLKKRPFLIACIAVALVALYTLFRKSNQAEDTAQTMLVADGYDDLTVSGTPAYEGTYAGGSSGTYELMLNAIEDIQSQYDNQLNIMKDDFTSQLTQTQNAYDTQLDTMSLQMSQLSEKYDTQSDIIAEQSSVIAMQNDIQTMKNNSDAWFYATTDARKEALSQANQAIAKKWGWTFNNSDGYWYDTNGIKVYSTTTQENMQTVETIPTKTASSATTSSSKKSSGGSSKKANTSSGLSTSGLYGLTGQSKSTSKSSSSSKTSTSTSTSTGGSTTKVNPNTGKTYSTKIPDWLDT